MGTSVMFTCAYCGKATSVCERATVLPLMPDDGRSPAKGFTICALKYAGRSATGRLFNISAGMGLRGNCSRSFWGMLTKKNGSAQEPHHNFAWDTNENRGVRGK